MSATTVDRFGWPRLRGRCQRSRIRSAVAVAVIAGAALAGPIQPAPASAAAGAAAAPFCGITWGSLPRTAGPAPTGPNAAVTGLRSGEHACYDRVVWDLSGPPPQARVEYVPFVGDAGIGRIVPLRGGAFLRLVFMEAMLPAWSGSGVDLVSCDRCTLTLG